METEHLWQRQKSRAEKKLVYILITSIGNEVTCVLPFTDKDHAVETASEFLQSGKDGVKVTVIETVLDSI